jgi:nitrogen regulatory protein P-II 1
MQIGVSMKELVIIIRPEKLEIVKAIIDDKKLGGMTISSVMGCGTQRGVDSEEFTNEIKGFKTTINLLT